MNLLSLAEQFIDDVLDNQGDYPDTIVLLVQNIVRDLEDPECEYVFDDNSAEHALNIIGSFEMTSGDVAGSTFASVMRPDQAFLIAQIFGWKRQNGTRRYRELLLFIPRKAGKSFLASGIAFYEYLTSGIGSQVYSAASTKDQAGIVFKTAKGIANRAIRKSPALRNMLNIRKYTLEKNNDSEAMFKALASNTDSLDGLNIQCAIMDEVHAYKDDSLYQVLVTSQGVRKQPLNLLITTAGFVTEGFLHQRVKQSKLILAGEIDDDSLFPMLWCPDEGDDLTSMDTWMKVNPALRHGSITESYYSETYNRAKNNNELGKWNVKNLNIFLSGGEAWVTNESWDKCDWKADYSTLVKTDVFMGLDLSVTRDMTALALFFPEQNVFQVFHFLPEDNIDKVSVAAGLDLSKFVDSDNCFLELTNGNIVDYDYVKRTIESLADKYKLQNLYYDRYNSSQLIIELTDMNIPLEAMSQSFFAISPVVGELTKGFESKELSHQGDTLINWQRSNLALETDASGNIKFSKKKSAKKIDGLVAMVMAYAAYIDWHKSGGGNNSKFNDSDRGLLIL